MPTELARFNKTKGASDSLAEGDEFDIDIRSPWDGPVRVIDKTPTSFTFATLVGHMEAGKITFTAEPWEKEKKGLRFTIESRARSRDGVVDFFYDKLGLAKEAQEKMWTFFCERVAEQCEGEQVGPVDVLTERAPSPGGGD